MQPVTLSRRAQPESLAPLLHQVHNAAYMKELSFLVLTLVGFGVLFMMLWVTA